MYLEIIDKNNQTIFTNLPQQYRELFQDNKNSKKDGFRSIFKEDNDNTSFWIISNDKDFHKSTRIANKTFNILKELFPIIHKRYELTTLSNTHTIATIQAKMSQKMESLIHRENLRGNYQQATMTIKSEIEKNPQDVAKIICDLNKRIEELDTHLKSLKILNNKTAVNFQSHSLKKMLLNIYAPFQANFNDKGIRVNFDRIDENIKIKVDYKIFSLISHHFFDNAVKYSKRNEEISLVYSTDNHLVIRMNSLKIEQEDNIFEIGVSGSNTDNLAGSGIGMHVIKQGLKMMHMDMDICDDGKLEKSKRHHKNQFIIACNICLNSD